MLLHIGISLQQNEFRFTNFSEDSVTSNSIEIRSLQVDKYRRTDC
jgi:hypothetical protein